MNEMMMLITFIGHLNTFGTLCIGIKRFFVLIMITFCFNNSLFLSVCPYSNVGMIQIFQIPDLK